MIYFSPMFGEEYKENPFKSTERTYPVENPYNIAETYLMNLEIPADYMVDEIPKSSSVNLGDGDGFFEYIIDNTGTTVWLRSRIKLNKANFALEEYNDLREFFSYVVKNHAEPIVFKKKK